LCHIEALKYNTRVDFYNNSNKFHAASCRYGWLNDVCSHMVILNKHWTIDECKEIALKYSNKTEFIENDKAAYTWARRKNIIDDICSHMTSKHRPHKYWTKERCQEEALKYETKTEFYKHSGGACDAIRRNGWNEEICVQTKNII
jgi:hypothetical protein